jgi:murein DD-endopeptidase MepM/ murein hydrolase activator NlpD
VAKDYIKNVGSSFKYAVPSLIKSMMPGSTDLISVNRDEIKDLTSKVKGIIKDSKAEESSFNEYKSDAKTLTKNFTDALKSGKLYDPKRKEKSENELYKAFGFDLEELGLDGISDMDIEGDLSEFTSDESSETEETSNKEYNLTRTQNNKINHNNITRNHNTVINNVVRNTVPAEARSGSSKMLSNVTLAVGEKQLTAINRVTSGINKMLEFQTTQTYEYYKQSHIYSAGSMGLLSEINSNITDLKSVLKRHLAAGTRERVVNDVYDPFSGTFNAKNYFQLVAQRTAEESGAGMMSGMGDFFKSQWKSIVQDPMSHAFEGVMKKFLPSDFQKSIKRMDETLSSLPANMLLAINGLKESNNSFLRKIGKSFGIDMTDTQVKLGNYEKGPIPFDGVTKRAIVNVMPSLLGKILSAIKASSTYDPKRDSGQLIYNYERGMFQTKEQTLSNLNAMRNDAVRGAVGSEREAIVSGLVSKYKEKNPEMSERDRRELQRNLEDRVTNSFMSLARRGTAVKAGGNAFENATDPVEVAINRYVQSQGGNLFSFNRNIASMIAAANGLNNQLSGSTGYNNGTHVLMDEGRIALTRDIAAQRSRVAESTSLDLDQISFGGEGNPRNRSALAQRVDSALNSSMVDFDGSLGEGSSFTDKLKYYYNKPFKLASRGIQKINEGLSTLFFGGRDGDRRNGVFREIKDFFMKDIMEPVKVKLLGELNSEGKREGGLFRDMMNSIKVNVVDPTGRFFKEKLIPEIKDSVQAVRNTLIGERDAESGDYRDGILSAAVNNTRKIFRNTNKAIFGNEEGETDTKRLIPRELREKMGKYGIGAGAGALASLFLPGGMMMGAAIGMIHQTDKARDYLYNEETGLVPRLKNKVLGTMDSFKKYVFGDKESNDPTKMNGLIPKEIQEKAGKFGMGLGGGVVASLFLPGGALAWSVLGLVHQTEAVQKFLYDRQDGVFFKAGRGINRFVFGEEREDGTQTPSIKDRLFDKDTGLLRQVSNRMNTFLFGTENDDGEKRGGLVTEMLRTGKEKIWQPFKLTIQRDFGRIKNFFVSQIIEPMKGSFAPYVKEFQLQIEKVKLMGVDMLKRFGDTSGAVFEATFGVKFTDMMTKYFIDPLTSTLKAVKNMTFKLMKTILTAPMKAFQAGGRALDRRHRRLEDAYSVDPNSLSESERRRMDRYRRRRERSVRAMQILNERRDRRAAGRAQLDAANQSPEVHATNTVTQAINTSSEKTNDLLTRIYRTLRRGAEGTSDLGRTYLEYNRERSNRISLVGGFDRESYDIARSRVADRRQQRRAASGTFEGFQRRQEVERREERQKSFQSRLLEHTERTAEHTGSFAKFGRNIGRFLMAAGAMMGPLVTMLQAMGLIKGGSTIAGAAGDIATARALGGASGGAAAAGAAGAAGAARPGLFRRGMDSLKNNGFKSTASKTASVIGKGAMKGARFIPGVGLVLAAGTAAWDGVQGWGKAEERFGTEDASVGQKISSALGSALTLGFGGDGLSQAIYGIGKVITAPFRAIVDILKTVAGTVKTFGQMIITGFKVPLELIKSAGKIIGAVGRTIGSILAIPFKIIGAFFSDDGENKTKKLSEVILPLLDKGLAFFTDGITKVVNGIEWITDKLVKVIEFPVKLIDGAIEGVVSAIKKVASIPKMMIKAVTKPFESFFGWIGEVVRHPVKFLTGGLTFEEYEKGGAKKISEEGQKELKSTGIALLDQRNQLLSRNGEEKVSMEDSVKMGLAKFYSQEKSGQSLLENTLKTTGLLGGMSTGITGNFKILGKAMELTKKGFENQAERIKEFVNDRVSALAQGANLIMKGLNWSFNKLTDGFIKDAEYEIEIGRTPKDESRLRQITLAKKTPGETGLFGALKSLPDILKQGINGLGDKLVGLGRAVGGALGGGSSSAGGTVPGSSELGALSEKYESGGRGAGTIANNKGDLGGASYGTYQIATNTGTMTTFLKFLSQNNPEMYKALSGKKPGTAAFNSAWKELAKRDPQGFQQAQHAFIKSSHYDPAFNNVKKDTGLDVSQRSKAVQDVLWSVAVQHGAGQKIFQRALAGKDVSKMSDEQIINAVYDERSAEGGSKYFGRSSASIRSGVMNRFSNERKDALAMLKENPAAVPTTIDGGGKITSAAGASVSGSTSGNATDFFTKQGFKMTSPYGMRNIFGKKQMHRGIDFAAPEGTALRTPVAGKVVFSGWANGYGNTIGIEDSSKHVHVFGHNKSNMVKVGQTVKAGDQIGLVGSTGQSTGPHVHYQVNKPGGGISGVNSIGDPNKYKFPGGMASVAQTPGAGISGSMDSSPIFADSEMQSQPQVNKAVEFLQKYKEKVAAGKGKPIEFEDSSLNSKKSEIKKAVPAPKTSVDGGNNKPEAKKTVELISKDYVVKKGDYLGKIAKAHGTTVAQILKDNPSIKNKNLIYPGDRIKLQVPTSKVAGVQKANNEAKAAIQKSDAKLASSLNTPAPGIKATSERVLREVNPDSKASLSTPKRIQEEKTSLNSTSALMDLVSISKQNSGYLREMVGILKNIEEGSGMEKKEQPAKGEENSEGGSKAPRTNPGNRTGDIFTSSVYQMVDDRARSNSAREMSNYDIDPSVSALAKGH